MYFSAKNLMTKFQLNTNQENNIIIIQHSDRNNSVIYITVLFIYNFADVFNTLQLFHKIITNEKIENPI